jgi:hypothetical protein
MTLYDSKAGKQAAGKSGVGSGSQVARTLRDAALHPEGGPQAAIRCVATVPRAAGSTPLPWAKKSQAVGLKVLFFRLAQ